MTEAHVETTHRIQEPHVPEANTVEQKGNRVFYALGNSTRNSRIVREGPKAERSLDLRAKRADLYKEILKTPDRARRKELLAEARARDEIESQYLAQGEITVDLPGLGEQSAHYTMIEPPEGQKLQGEYDPIFLIPGIANDIDSVGSLAKEIAYQGRSVIVVGMPESQMGIATKEFADAVKQSPTMEAHAGFFKAVIDKMVGEEQPVELWGMSAGSMITAEILNDPTFSERVKQAVLLSPAGTSEQGMMQQNIGVATEALRVFRRPSRGAHYSLVMDRNSNQVQKSESDKDIAGEIFNSVREKTLTKFEPYHTMKVAEGGQITIVTGRKDAMTRSTESNDQFRAHRQVELISLKNGVHNTPIIQADKVVPKVFERQQLADVRSELWKL